MIEGTDYLITKKGELLIFVEVKTKTYVAYGNPEDSVDERKAAKVVEGAEEYVYQNNWNGDIRFDIISIVLSKEYWWWVVPFTIITTSIGYSSYY